MHIVVTGGTGFLGQKLVAQLEQDMPGAIITPIGCRSYNSSNTQPIYADLRNAELTHRTFQRLRPNLVFHLAATVGGIVANVNSPGTFFRDNMQMGLNVIEASRRCEVNKLVFVGTTCSYPKDAPLPLRATDLWNGYPETSNAPYGVAKRALITMIDAYRKEFNCNFVTAIPANLYGPGDSFDLEKSHVIPGMIRRFVEAKEQNKNVVLWGDGSPSREFLYANDAATALVKIGQKYNGADPVNIGTGIETTIGELASIIAKLVGYTAGVIIWDVKKPNGQPRRVLEVLKSYTGMTPLEVGLSHTINWYLANRKLADRA